MKTRSAKAKGRRLQNKVARDLQEAFGLPEADIRPAIMGEGGEDIKMSKAAREVCPLAIECKNQEKLNIWAALRQAEAHRGPDALPVPIVVFSRNRAPTYMATTRFGWRTTTRRAPRSPLRETKRINIWKELAEQQFISFQRPGGTPYIATLWDEFLSLIKP